MLIDDAIADLLPIARDHTRPRSAVEAWNAIRGWADRKARLLGLDAPARSKVEVITEEMVDAEIRRLETEMGRRWAMGHDSGIRGGRSAQTSAQCSPRQDAHKAGACARPRGRSDARPAPSCTW